MLSPCKSNGLFLRLIRSRHKYVTLLKTLYIGLEQSKSISSITLRDCSPNQVFKRGIKYSIDLPGIYIYTTSQLLYNSRELILRLLILTTVIHLFTHETNVVLELCVRYIEEPLFLTLMWWRCLCSFWLWIVFGLPISALFNLPIVSQ